MTRPRDETAVMYCRDINSSQVCHDDLNEHQLIQHYSAWEHKLQGTMAGLTLFGKRKDQSDKKVYVKKYEELSGLEFHILDDIMVFDILRSFSIIAPKAKIKSTSHSSYLFSTEITQQQNCRDPHPEFQPMSKIIPRDTPYQRHPHKNQLTATKNTLHKVIQVDTANLAKFILLCFLLRLNDLHSSNIGIFIERIGDVSTAKPAIIDFMINYPKLAISDASQKASLSSMIVSDLGYFSFLRMTSLATLDEDDYQHAFKDLEARFLTACDQALMHAKKYAPADSYDIWHAEIVSRQWQSNFAVMKNIAQQSNHNHSTSPDRRATIIR